MGFFNIQSLYRKVNIGTRIPKDKNPSVVYNTHGQSGRSSYEGTYFSLRRYGNVAELVLDGEAINGQTGQLDEVFPSTFNPSHNNVYGYFPDYLFEIDAVFITNLVNVANTGNGRLVFTVTGLEDAPQNLSVAVRDITQNAESLSAGTVYEGDVDSSNCNLWYDAPLVAGEHEFEAWCLNQTGQRVSNIFTFQRTV